MKIDLDELGLTGSVSEVAAGHKRCTKCGQFKSATTENFFYSERNRGNLASECKTCKKLRVGDYNTRWYEANRESQLLKSYALSDKKALRQTNITVQWLKENVTSKPCYYCGTTDDPRGSDRLDNTVGHVIGNVVPCCQLCNKTRNASFTVDEMFLLGEVIAKIRQRRKNVQH